jgi:hypothetical protein
MFRTDFYWLLNRLYSKQGLRGLPRSARHRGEKNIHCLVAAMSAESNFCPTGELSQHLLTPAHDL